MTVLNLCHSEEAQRADVGIRPFYDERGFGPMYLGHGFRRPNFVPKFGASVMGIGPYGEKGKPHQPPWPAEQSICASGHKGWVGHAAEIIPKCPATSGNPSIAA